MAQSLVHPLLRSTALRLSRDAVCLVMQAKRNNHSVEGFIGCIGNTPLVHLSTLSKMAGGHKIYAKAEWMNPGGSVKDRAAWYVVKDAEERGLITHGGVIVEGSWFESIF